MIGKSSLAATLSWFVGHDVLDGESPAFAPFSAVLVIQVTVYQSLLQSLRYVGAVCSGVAVQAVLALLTGPDLVTFVLVALITMAIGRWRRLAEQGSQVVTGAFFAFATYAAAGESTERLAQLGEIVLLVAIGCTIGVAVNVVLLPPMRYRGVEHGVRALAHALCHLLDDVRPALHEHDLSEERTRHWRSRVAQLQGLVDQARSALRTAVEARHLNPLRMLPSYRHPEFSGYRQVLDALERVTHQVASLTRTLEQWPGSEVGQECDAFLHDYAELLAALGTIAEQLSRLDEQQLPHQSRELCRAADAAQEKRRRLVDRAESTDLALGDPSRPYGILLAEGVRLMDEAQHTCNVLRHTVDRAGKHGRTPADTTAA
ncbi:FUSC family protein [Streptomyces xiaopingdaonensis]|uniref:FUSC family protein n=1 Tax=Streptomyces xiaopingdaonensis TaxID=1565415 RepID=UPI000302F853|nr:aromatic acid exporter family protein [Streptomyces xiaopingdaonensis]